MYYGELSLDLNGFVKMVFLKAGVNEEKELITFSQLCDVAFAKPLLANFLGLAGTILATEL
jgi:hypothetical protein